MTNSTADTPRPRGNTISVQNNSTTRTDRTTVIAWAFWDWGSAAFNAVLVTFVFSVYLTSSVGDNLSGSTSPTSWYSWAMAVAGVTIALIAPVMGRRTDTRGTRRRSVATWTVVTFLLMASLFFIRNDAEVYFWAGLVILAVASVTFQFAEVSYFAMLGQVSTPQNVGRVSGFGWSMGYFGGIVLLLVSYVGLISGSGDRVGLLEITTDGGLNIRLVALFAAFWFLIFGLPVLFRVPEIQRDPTVEPTSIIDSYKRLFREICGLWHTDRRVVLFLISSAVFRDGLAGVFAFGAIIAVKVYGIGVADVLIFGIAANVVSAAGALVCGYLDDRFGPKPVILGSLIFMIVDCIVLLFIDGSAMFWVFGLILCLFVGPAQSASRSFLTRLTPQGREGQMFGLYATTGRAVSWLAPAAFGVFVAIFSTDRAGIAGIALVLTAGLLLLLPVAQD